MIPFKRKLTTVSIVNSVVLLPNISKRGEHFEEGRALIRDHA